MAALATLRPFTPEDLRLVHIRNTLAMERLEVSPGCVPHLHDARRPHRDARAGAASPSTPTARSSRGCRESAIVMRASRP